MSSPSPILDSAVMDELRALGRELEQDVLGEVVAAYRKLAPELLSQMTEAASSRSLEALARAAHTLKGGSAQIGARAVSERARLVEAAARAGQAESLVALVEDCRAAHVDADEALGLALEEKS
jgi:HPt (histidine-containing phosphotransfer) domain-containing protein